MAAFNLYRANCIGNEWNCLYPHKVCVSDEESLRQAVCQDYVAVEYAKGYRSNENFIRTNCRRWIVITGKARIPRTGYRRRRFSACFRTSRSAFISAATTTCPRRAKALDPGSIAFS